jgi:hypothetical protein
VEKISIAVNNYFATLDGGESLAASEGESAGEALTDRAGSDAIINEASLEEGTVEADALAGDPENTGEAPSPGDGELEAARLAAEAESIAAEPTAKAELLTEETSTEEAPEDKQS